MTDPDLPSASPSELPAEIQVRRHPERQSQDPSALHAILDEALVAHVGVVRDGLPVVIPFACARDGDAVLLHGSTGAGVLRIASGAPVAVTVTLLDGRSRDVRGHAARELAATLVLRVPPGAGARQGGEGNARAPRGR